MNINRFFIFLFISLTVSCEEYRGSRILLPENVLVDTIPFASEPPSNIILLEVTTKGKPYKFIFDTGFSRTLIDSSIPVSKVNPDTVYFRDLLNRTHSSFSVIVDTLQIGKLTAINLDSYHQRDLDLDGILGEDIIGEMVWKFDLLNREMHLTRDLENLGRPEVSLPLKRNGQFIVLSCHINEKEIDLIVDTGYSGFVLLDRETADSLSFFGKTPIFWEGISTMHTINPNPSPMSQPHVDSTYYFTGNITAGDIVLENEIFELRNNSLNIVGMEFFKRFEYFILDYPNRQIHFGKIQPKSLDFVISSVIRLNTKGVTLIPSSSNTQIGRVTEWAKAAGINYLDTVISIDEIPILNRDSSFYQDRSVMHEDISFLDYRPSPFVQLVDKFNFLSDTSQIGIKKGDQIQNFTLIRQYNFMEMPDSIQDYYLNMALPSHQFKKTKKGSASYYTFKTSDLLPSGLRRKLVSYDKGQELDN